MWRLASAAEYSFTCLALSHGAPTRPTNGTTLHETRKFDFFGKCKVLYSIIGKHFLKALAESNEHEKSSRRLLLLIASKSD